MVRACNLHAPTGSDTLRGLVGKKGLEWYFPAVGQVRFLASQEVIGLSGHCHVSKTWEYLNDLMGGRPVARIFYGGGGGAMIFYGGGGEFWTIYF